MDKERLVQDDEEMIPEVYATYGGTMMIQAKFPGAKSKKNPEGFTLPKSDYTMDEVEGPRGIKAMLAAMSNKDPRAQRGPAQQGAPDLAAAAAAKENK